MTRIPKLVPRVEQRTLAEHKSGAASRFDPPQSMIDCEFFNDDFEVKVNALPCPVRACRVSAMPFNRVWPGKQRNLSQTELASFVTFSSDEPVRVEVESRRNVKTAVLRPLSRSAAPEVNGNRVSFTLTEHGGYSLEINGVHKNLHIFFNPVKNYPDAENATYFFGPGLHCPGRISLRSGESVYIDDEAIVFGSLYAKGQKNIRVFGGGVLDDRGERRILEHCYEDFTNGCIRLYDCEDVRIEDVILTDSSTWVLSMFYCRGVAIDGVKIVGHWRYNTDGIDVVNSRDVSVKNCFIRSFDDTISIKGIYDFDGIIENVSVENCVLWCDWGHTAEIGIETAAKEYRNVSFADCALIHNQTGAIAIRNGLFSDIHDILYRDISIEIEKDRPVMMLQESDDQIYDPAGFAGDPKNHCAVMIDNRFMSSSMVGKPYPPISRVTLKNVDVLTDDAGLRPRFVFRSHDANVIFKDVVFDGVSVNGVKQTDLSAFSAELDNTEYTIR